MLLYFIEGAVTAEARRSSDPRTDDYDGVASGILRAE